METSNTQRILGECADRALSRFPGTTKVATDDRTFYFTSLLAYELCNAGSPLGTKLLDLVELDAQARQPLADRVMHPGFAVDQPGHCSSHAASTPCNFPLSDPPAPSQGAETHALDPMAHPTSPPSNFHPAPTESTPESRQRPPGDIGGHIPPRAL